MLVHESLVIRLPHHAIEATDSMQQIEYRAFAARFSPTIILFSAWADRLGPFSEDVF